MRDTLQLPIPLGQQRGVREAGKMEEQVFFSICLFLIIVEVEEVLLEGIL